MTTLSFGREPGLSALDDTNRRLDKQPQPSPNQEAAESSEKDTNLQASSRLRRIKRKNWTSPLALISHLHAGME